MGTTRPAWADGQIDEAVALAVRAVDEPIEDGRILVRAQAPNAHLALIALGADMPWAMVIVVSTLDGVSEPFQLSTVVPTDRAEYFTDGSGWWPRPGTPRWFWSVGRVSDAAQRVQVQLDGKVSAVPVTKARWFAHLHEGDEETDAATISVI